MDLHEHSPLKPAVVRRVLRNRIARVGEHLSKLQKAAFVVASAPLRLLSHDVAFPFRQDSDFFYLTGSNIEECALVLSTSRREPVLFAKKVSALQKLWDGPGHDPRTIARAIGAELKYADDVYGALRQEVLGHDILFHQNSTEGMGLRLAREILETPRGLHAKVPLELRHVHRVLEPMRRKKDELEISLIRAAGLITTAGLEEAAWALMPGQTETQVASALESAFRRAGATCGFETIVAAGKNAGVLHHRASQAVVKRGDMVLIDCGASFLLHNGDITRVLPASGRFDPLQRDLYTIVLDAQTAAIAKVKAGTKIRPVYDAAARVISRGLRDLGVLKGSLDAILEKEAYREYFPHGIGHSLGLDVHDVGNVRGNKDAHLEAGMVITVEPGIYFGTPAGRVPRCGVRIEDNVLVTKSGCEILTVECPKALDHIEALCGGVS